MQSVPKKTEITETDIIIIGAGPAGLACSNALKKLNLKSIILESGTDVGYAWSKMPDNLKLGPWISSQIDKSISWFKLLSCPYAKSYASYLKSFALKEKLDVRCNQKVKSIKKVEKIFFLKTTASKLYKASCVVNATGYFQNPIFPDWVKKINNSCKVLHYNQYRNSNCISSSKENMKILIVGGGISAGELLLDLEKKHHSITLSIRNEIKFERPRWLQLLVSPFYFWLEEKFPTSKKLGSSKRYMAGGKTKRIINSGRINIIGPIKKVSDNLFYHSKGTEKFDVVILATGWKSNLSHLDSVLLGNDGEPRTYNMESKIWSGFFFLGVDNLISHRSRFIRGIRSDAELLANTILNYFELRSKTSQT